MPPNETDHLLSLSSTTTTTTNTTNNNAIELVNDRYDNDDDDDDVDDSSSHNNNHIHRRCGSFLVTKVMKWHPFMWYHVTIWIILIVVSSIAWQQHCTISTTTIRPNNNNNIPQHHNTDDDDTTTESTFVTTGPYTVIKEVQEGNDFWNYYNFYEGNDTLGSAGYNTYVNMSYAILHNLIQIIPSNNNDHRDIIYMKSKPTDAGPRESIRIEGKTRFTSHVGGLFILDVDHIPVGCGQWPAFWLTDTLHWPYHGEIDIVEGVNLQNKVKTALHTSDMCSMYAHVPSYQMTGTWDRATGIPDTYTGTMDYTTNVPADNCYAMAPHQWMNQGCVIESNHDNTIGVGFNQIGKGGIYVLQWDPIVTQSIQSYVFLKSSNTIPSNLIDSIKYASYRNRDRTIGERYMMDPSMNPIPKETYPNPQIWNDDNGSRLLPYAYFAIGNTTGCSAQHFDHMNVIFNLAFCGNVAGNRFIMDQCHVSTTTTRTTTNTDSTTTNNNHLLDPITLCNDYIKSQPDELNEAYWAIRGVYIYERSSD